MAEVEFFGETFALASEVSEFAWMEFASAAADGQDGDTMQGYASMMTLLRACIEQKDWPRFRATARKNRASFESLLPVIQAVFEQQADLPTGGSSDSSDGPAVTVQKSEPSAADKASAAFPGRPDLQLAVLPSLSA